MTVLWLGNLKQTYEIQIKTEADAIFGLLLLSLCLSEIIFLPFIFHTLSSSFLVCLLNMLMLIVGWLDLSAAWIKAKLLSFVMDFFTY